MNKDSSVYYTLKGMITELPQQEQEKINAAADKLRSVLAEYGDEGVIAMSLVACEREAKS